ALVLILRDCSKRTRQHRCRVFCLLIFTVVILLSPKTRSLYGEGDDTCFVATPPIIPSVEMPRYVQMVLARHDMDRSADSACALVRGRPGRDGYCDADRRSTCSIRVDGLGCGRPRCDAEGHCSRSRGSICGAGCAGKCMGDSRDHRSDECFAARVALCVADKEEC